MALTDEIFSMDAKERRCEFESIYMFRFQRLAHSGAEDARKTIMTKIANDPEAFMNELEASEVWKKAINTGLIEASKDGISHTLNSLVAAEVVKASIGGAVSATGRRGAVFVIEQSSGMAVVQGAHAAVNGVKLGGAMGAFLPGLVGLVGQTVANKLGDEAGVKDYRLKNGISIAGGIVGGAIAGMAVGGPIGFAVGAGTGAVGWGIGKTIDALTISGLGVKGPDDNWAWIKTGTVNGKVCIGTYGASDTVYFKSYWNEYRGSDCGMFVMSAGQSKMGSFQLCVWDQHNNVIQHFNRVYYRDFFHVGKKDGKHYVARCKGELWGGEGGQVDIWGGGGKVDM